MTPGQICYEAFFRTKAGTSVAQTVAWGYERLDPVDRQCWEAAAQAVAARAVADTLEGQRLLAGALRRMEDTP